MCASLKRNVKRFHHSKARPRYEISSHDLGPRRGSPCCRIKFNANQAARDEIGTIFCQIINNRASDRNPGRWEETRADPINLQIRTTCTKVRVRTCPECVVTLAGKTRAPALGWRAARTAFIAALWCDVSMLLASAQRSAPASALFQSHRASDHFSCPLSP